MLKELGAWIETKTALVVGTDLFLGFADQDASDIATLNILLDNTGSLLFPDLKDRADYVITHIARHQHWETAYTMARLIFDTIHMRTNITFPIVAGATELNCQVMYADSTPQYMVEDLKRRHSFSTNYTFKIKNKV